MDSIVRTLVGVAAAVGIIAGTLYISNHVSWGCADLYFFKTCSISAK